MSNVTPIRSDPIWFSVLTRTVDVDYFWVPGESRDAIETLIREWYDLFLSDNHLDKSQPNVPTILLADFGGLVTVVFGGLLASKGDGARPILNALALCLRPEDRAVAYQLVSGLLEGGERAGRIGAELIKISENRCQKPFPQFLGCLSVVPNLSLSGSGSPQGRRVDGLMFRILDEGTSQEASGQVIAVGSELANRRVATEGYKEIFYLFVRAKIIDQKKKGDFFSSINEKGIKIHSGTILSKSTWPGPEGYLEGQKKKWARFLTNLAKKMGYWTWLVLILPLFLALVGVFWMIWVRESGKSDPSGPRPDTVTPPRVAVLANPAEIAGLVGLGFPGNSLAATATLRLIVLAPTASQVGGK